VKKKGFVALAIVAFVSVLFAVAGGTGLAARKASIKIALVTDIGGLNDRSFNQAANAGRLRVESKLHIPTRVYVTASAADRLTNIETAAQAGYNLIFGTGFFMGAPLGQVAPKYPNIQFAGIDVNVNTDLGSGVHPSNVRGLIFHEQEAGYVVGYIAGLVLKQQKGPQVASAVGANTVPAIVRYIGGFKAGVKKADPKATVLADYANDPTFSDQAKCKETALNQIQKHTQVIFQVAGGCGLGALAAAKEHHLWGIGVDVDQGYLGSYVLTSAMKNVANAVYLTSKEFQKNPSAFKGGFNKVFDAKNGGIGYGKLSKKLKNRAAIAKKANHILKLIASGKIVPPTK
jgi:basic membrane protein A